MLSNAVKPIDQDMAVTTLLQIDSKDQQDLNIWQEKRTNKVANKVRRYSFYKPHPSKINNQNKLHGEAIDNLANSQTHYYQTPKKLKQPSNTMNPQEEPTIKKLMSKSSAFNELQYWQSRMNWMYKSQQKQHFSQPKITKKISFVHENSARKSNRAVSRYGDDSKTQKQQYKTNLIYSLLANKDILQEREQPKLVNNPSRSTPSTQKTQKKITSKQAKQESSSDLDNQMQTYMRETLKKIYLKNRNNEHYDPQTKHSQQQRGSIIRQILINLQNIKDHQNVIHEPNVKENKPSSKQLQLIDNKGLEQLTTVIKPQRHLYHQNQRHILNLNLQAQKIYKSRSINQCGVKKNILKVQ